MESDSGPCPDRCGRYGLGVAGRCGCEGVETGSPGDSARCRGVTARARLVGGAERRGGARGARPQSLSRAGALERARVHPRGWQVGLLGRGGMPTRLASGGEGTEKLEGIFSKILCMHGPGFPLLLPFLEISLKQGWAGVVPGAMPAILHGICC
jgi:hypothetical protein